MRKYVKIFFLVIALLLLLGTFVFPMDEIPAKGRAL